MHCIPAGYCREEGGVYHLDIYNGLPADHIYSAITDQYGYLWLCTTNGVVRYNGYELKTFSFSEGLPTNDVWGLHLDHKGRIWLRCMANQIGYIYRNRYHAAYVPANSSTFYPRHIADYDSGVVFFTAIQQRGDRSLCFEKNDTVFFAGTYSNEADVIGPGRFIDYGNNYVRTGSVSGDMHVQPGRSCSYHTSGDANEVRTTLLDYLSTYSRKSNYLSVFHTGDCSERKLFFYDAQHRPDTISFCDFYGGSIYVIAARNVYRINARLQVTDTFPVATLCSGGFSGRDVTNFFEDRFWGRCTTTRTDGVYFSFGTASSYRHMSEDFVPVGAVADSIALCWNEKKQVMQFTAPDGTFIYRDYPQMSGVRHVAALDMMRSLLVTDKEVFILLHSTWSVTPLMTGIRHVLPAGETTYYTSGLANVKTIATGDPGQIYLGYQGIRVLQLHHDTLISKPVTNSTFYGIEPGAPGNITWVYNNNQLLAYGANGTVLNIPADYFRKMGISNIGQVMADRRYGNLFVKDQEHLYMFDPAKAVLRKLFSNYNLREAKCRLDGDKLVIAGRFGVLVSSIKGYNVLSQPVVYPNVKSTMYLQVLDLVVLRDRIMLQTDAGNYLLQLPAGNESEHDGNAQPQCRFIAEYDDNIYDLQEQKKIHIDQRNDRIQLDLVNPWGNGRVHYSYRLTGTGDNNWHLLHANELRLPALEPGATCTLSLAAGDDVWRGASIDIQLYVIPYWWQTRGWRIAIAVTVAVALMALLLLVILLTRYFVSKQNKKRQSLTELKLRAIYAQINPHFIFNTLNAALYFIRKKQLDEAHTHITRFSRLLWSYLESSRSRYITIADEIRNISHYIELQQTRFEGLFDYEIRVDPSLEPHMVMIPSLLLQPIIENAINHGLVPMETGGRLHIVFDRANGDGDIHIMIDDNGVGRKKHTADDNNPLRKRSYGNQLIKELVLLFNRYEKMVIEMNYIDKELPETGTTVIISIKNPQYDTATYENDPLRHSR